ncbi:hypothetical protein [Amycolatopsis thermoflava]|uniref:hypothetical protein n=1 Tax=Amycolatopsis thermoflava TaxID=84480 RepID=UPI0036552EB8
MATAITVRVQIDGVRDALQAFRELPKDANDRLRDESMKLATRLAERVKADGMADAAPQSPLVATTVKARRDRVPVIEAGGTKRLGSRRAPAYKLLFGSLFGSNAYRQFHRPHGGRDAYWFFPIVEEAAPEISATWNRVADEIVRDFSAGG